MGSRVQLQALLEEMLGSKNVYFQPPSSVEIKYPCIIYSRSDEDVIYADNKPYIRAVGYKVTVIDSNPDSQIPSKIAALPMCSFDRPYTASNLYHNVYKLYY